jgi:hypothetical protein
MIVVGKCYCSWAALDCYIPDCNLRMVAYYYCRLVEWAIMRELIDCCIPVEQATSWSNRSLWFNCILGFTADYSRSSANRIPDCTDHSCSCSAAESERVSLLRVQSQNSSFHRH